MSPGGGIARLAVPPPFLCLSPNRGRGSATMLLVLLLACPSPVPPPTPPVKPEWTDIARPPGSADGVRCWEWKGATPVCQWPSGGPVPPPVPPEPPKAEAAPAEAQ